MKVFITYCLLLSLSQVTFSEVDKQIWVEIKQTSLTSLQFEGSPVYIFKPNFHLSFSHVRGKDKGDFGLKLALFEKGVAKYKSIYESKGSGDSYILKPSFFGSDLLTKPLLILAEVGTEYSWGVRVFLINNQLEVNDLGALDVAVAYESEFADGVGSVIPFTRITENNGQYEFRFSKNVVYNPGGLKERLLGLNEIFYIYDGEALKEVISDR